VGEGLTDRMREEVGEDLHCFALRLPSQQCGKAMQVQCEPELNPDLN
jgi:hypothetical protein